MTLVTLVGKSAAATAMSSYFRRSVTRARCAKGAGAVQLYHVVRKRGELPASVPRP